MKQRLTIDRFPRSAGYDQQWVVDHEMGPHVLWLTEALCEVLPLQPGWRVLDLGCGRGLSSIFLAREFDLQVWATDLWIPAAENWTRIREAGLEERVFPVHAEARQLPFADDFFDAVVSIDSYQYYGTDVLYLEQHLLRLLKPGGPLGIVIPASPAPVPWPLPEHLPPDEWHWLRSVDWWRELWTRQPGLRLERCEAIEDGWGLWLRWHEALRDTGQWHRPWCEREFGQIQADGGRYLGWARLTARREEAT